MAIDNIISNETYIFKDFQSAYEELVDTIGKLNNKWLIDGEGNESDPGVVLIKSIAASIDKLSFNSDKNALENMPDKVQVEENARSLFSPVYNMKWYRSAVGTVTMRNNGDDDIVIPSYLMLCSDDGSAVYTIFGTQFTIGAHSTQSNIKVIEGRIKTLTANGSDCITIDSFVDNKIYLDDFNVAQNGIIVEPYDSTIDKNTWTMSDNIYVEMWAENEDINGGRYYEFRVDTATNRPYLHFVDDLPDKIGNGLKIRYIISNGVEGNISAGKLTKVFTSDSETIVQSENLRIANTSPISNGYDPETIEEAKRNYFKDIDICNTLVTLRDYTNAIYLADGLVSNCFVCDKTNDVQTFVLIDKDGNVERDTDGSQILSLMNLKFYGLTHRDMEYGIDGSQDTLTQNILYANNYKTTFDMINPQNESSHTPLVIPKNVDDYIYESRSISHEFSTIRNQNKICMLKDYYTLNIDLLFRQRLTDEQQTEIKNRVYKALMNSLNAHAIDFGEKITYNKVQQIIYSADSRILGASIYGLDDVNFSTKAVYWTPFVEVPLYDTLPTPSSKLNGQYGVVMNGTTAELYEVIASSWAKLEEYDTTGDRIYDLSTDDKFVAVYSEESTWAEKSVTGSSVAGNIWVCTSKPNASFLTSETPQPTIYKVTVTPWTEVMSALEITIFPSTPIKLTSVVSGSRYVKWANSYYKIEVQDIAWDYTEVPTFYYDARIDDTSNGIETVLGSFQEEFISSEIDKDGHYDDNLKIGITSGKGKLCGELQTEIYAKSVLAGKAGIYDTDFKFSPKLQDEKSQISDSIAYIQPSLSLSLTSEYQLRKNEYIQILTPEFETVANYAFYVYVGYYNTDASVQQLVIAENQNYELKSNEYIIFYYRSSDTDRYTYSIYNRGNIVCPSKTIVLYNLSFQSALIPAEPMTYKDNVTGVCTPSAQSAVSEATTATYARNRLSALKSQDSCDVKQLVKTDVKAYTFISNDFSVRDNKTTYTLTFKKMSDNGDGTTTYMRVLEEGEVLSYYHKDSVDSPYVIDGIVGAGTILSFITETPTPAVDEISKTSEISNGIQSPVDVLTDDEFTIIGSEIFQLGPDMFVKPIFGATATHSTTETSFTASTTHTDYDNAGFNDIVNVLASQISNEWSSNNNVANITSATYTSTGWDYWNNLISLVTSQVESTDWSSLPGGSATSRAIYIKYTNQHKTSGGKIENDDDYYFSLTYNITSQTSLDLTSEFVKYSTVPMIMYRNADETSYTTVQQSQISQFDSLIRSALLVSIEAGGNQVMSNYEGGGNHAIQRVYGYDNSGDSGAVFDTNSMLPSTDFVGQILLSSSENITAIGGKQPLGTPSTIYIADEKTSADSDSTHTYESDSISVTIGANSSNTLQIPGVVVGNGYIVYGHFGEQLEHKIRITSGTSGSEFCLTDMYGTAYGDDDAQPSDDEYYRTFSQTENSISLNITVECNGQITIYNGTDDVIEVVLSSQLVSYQYKTMLSDTQTQSILAKMGEFDTKQQFRMKGNYVYPISNPLASASFLDSNHPYNPFTICQMGGLNWRA